MGSFWGLILHVGVDLPCPHALRILRTNCALAAKIGRVIGHDVNFQKIKRNCWLNQFFCWRQHFYLKIRQILKIRYLLNRLSEKGGWPLVGMVLYGAIRNIRTDPSIVPIFCWRQHFLGKKCKNDVTLRHVTSSCWIFIKMLKSIVLPNIKLWCKYEVSSTNQAEIRVITIYSALTWEI